MKTQTIIQGLVAVAVLEGNNLHFTPQLWRTFESEVHLIPPLEEKIAQVGVFRKDLDSRVFQPKAK